MEFNIETETIKMHNSCLSDWMVYTIIESHSRWITWGRWLKYYVWYLKQTIKKFKRPKVVLLIQTLPVNIYCLDADLDIK